MSQNVARTNVIIDTTSATSSVNRLEQGVKKLDTSTQSAGRTGTTMGNAFTQTEQKIKRMDDGIRKMDADLTKSSKSQLGMQQNLDRIGQSMNKNVGSANALGNANRKLAQNLTGVQGGITGLDGKMKGLGTETATTGSKMSKMGGFMKGNLTNVSLLAGGIAGLDDQFLALHKAQVGNERASLMQDKAHQKVIKTQEALNKMVKSGKTGTADYAIKLKDLEIAKEADALATERATVTQENLNERTEDFWIGILPNLIFVAGSATSMISSMGISMGTLTTISTKLRGAMTSLSGSVGKLNGLMGAGIGAGFALGLAAVLYEINQNIETAFREAGIKITHFKSIFTSEINEVIAAGKQTVVEFDEIAKRSKASLIEQTLFPAETIARAKEFGLIIDKNGKIIETTTDRTFDLGIKTKASANEYILWTRNKLLQGEAIAKVYEWLVKESGLKPEVAAKVFAAATEDATLAQEHQLPVVKQMAEQKVKLADATVTATIALTDESKAWDAQHNRLDGVTDQAGEVANGLSEVGGEQIVLKEQIEKSNRALEYQTRDLGLVTSAADEVAAGESTGATILATYTDKVNEGNRALEYQKGRLDASTSSADEYANGITEGAEKTVLLEQNINKGNRALAYQTKAYDDVQSAADEAATGGEDVYTKAVIDQQQELETNIDLLQKQGLAYELGENAIVNFAAAQAKGSQSAEDFLLNLRFQATETEAWVFQMDQAIPGITKLAEQYKLTNQQIQGLTTSMATGTDEWKHFNDQFKSFTKEWNNAAGLKKVFKIESNVDKDIKDMVKDMEGKKYEGKLKLRLQIQQEQQDAKDSIAEFSKGFLTTLEGSQDFVWQPALKLKSGKLDEKSIDEFGKSVRDKLDDAIKGKKGTKGPDSDRFKDLSKQLDDAIDEGGQGGMDKLLAIVNANKDIFGGVEPIPVSIEETTLTNLATKISEVIKGGIYEVPVKPILDTGFSGAGFDFGEAETLGVVVDITKINKIDPAKCTDCDVMDTTANVIDVQFTPSPALGSAIGSGINAGVDSAERAGILDQIRARLWKNLFNFNTIPWGFAGAGQSTIGATGKTDAQKDADWNRELPNPGEDKPKNVDAGPFAELAKQSSVAGNAISANMAVGTKAIQTLQVAIGSLANYSTKNLASLGKAAKTHFNSVANYANGATTFIQTDQTAIESLKNYGTKNLASLGKASKTNFNSVANYADGSTEHVQTLATAIGSLAKYGTKQMGALAKSAKTNFNTVANYADGATTAVQDLQKAIDNLKDKTVTVTVNKQNTGGGGGFEGGGFNAFAMGGLAESKAKGDIKTVNRPTLFLYGDNPGNRETLAFIPHNNPTPTLEKLTKMFGNEMASVSGGGGGGSVVHIHNHFLQREVQQILNIERGRMISRMG